MKKKIATILTAAVIGATAFTTIVSAASGDITVVSREDGSGTRGAFIELFGVQQEENGEKAQNASYTLIGTLKASMESLIVLKAEDTIEVERISVG